MKNKYVTLVLVAALSTVAYGVQAKNLKPTQEKASKEETRGAITGFIVGAGLGGPFGASLGAMVGGGLIGKLMGVSRENRELNSSLAISKAALIRRDQKLNKRIAGLSQELAQMLKEQTQNWNTRQLPIQFRTGSSDIEQQYAKQLLQISIILSRNLDAKVSLSGFSDRRGDSDYNQRLSEQRVAGVKQFLINQGVSQSQVITAAYGESKPLNQDAGFENDFFDRRVVMQFSFDLKSYLASR